MTIKLSLPIIGNLLFIGKMPGGSLLFENEATGQKMLLPRSQMPWSRSGVSKLVEPMTDRRDGWGRPEILITEDGSGWDH